MLHYQTIEPGTLALLKRLMELPSLRGHSLVGGTALALKYGHRTSEDLDLFGFPLEKEQVITELEAEFGKDFVYKEVPGKWAIFSHILEIKTDIISYDHPVIGTPDLRDGIRMFSTEDIAAMKINAVFGRGTKKDFWDIFLLLKHYSLSELIGLYRQKYPSQQLLISVPHAITYFDDSENDANPKSLIKEDWMEIKSFIRQKVKEYLA